MTINKKIESALKVAGFLQNCPQDIFARFRECASYSTHDKGRVLFLQEEPAERFFIVESGWVKLFRETLDGEQAVIDVLSQGCVFAETAIFNDNTYPYSAEVVDRSELISLPLHILQTEVAKNDVITMNMLNQLAKHSRKQEKEIEHLALQSAPQRIGCFLLRLFDQSRQDLVTIHLPYDKTLIAARLGMQPETFSRALKKLRDATDIQVTGSTVLIKDISKLSSFSCGTCSSGFPCDDLRGCRSGEHIH